MEDAISISQLYFVILMEKYLSSYINANHYHFEATQCHPPQSPLLTNFLLLFSSRITIDAIIKFI